MSTMISGREDSSSEEVQSKSGTQEQVETIGESNDSDIPIHFFTIVLNGEPFVEYHIEVLKHLPFRWHWHVVEGVAELKHDTAWSLELGGKITDDIHRQGLSKDGTSEFLDRIAEQYPDHVTLYRKPEGQFWDGKKEMVNAPLKNIQEHCLLWQVDVDEFWTVEQICTARNLFIRNPDKTAAYYWCWYFLGEHIVISTRNCYGQDPEQDWLRTWRYRPGSSWATHEPPILAEPVGEKQYRNTARVNPFLHDETEREGLVFQHFAYVTLEQLEFKEKYYGLRYAVQQWQALQDVSQFPVLLKNYFYWVKDHTVVDTASACGIRPLAYREATQWKFVQPMILSNQQDQSKTALSEDTAGTLGFSSVCSVFFYVIEGEFPSLSVCIAEGLKELGIPIYANINYWRTSTNQEEYLFKHDPNVRHQDCSLVVFDKDWMFLQRPLPEGIFAENRNYQVIYLDNSDGPWPSLYPEISQQFDFVFRTHCTLYSQHTHQLFISADELETDESSNIFPWVFGISNRILKATSNLPDFDQRNPSILANFRVDQRYLNIGTSPQKINRGTLFIKEGVIVADNPLRILSQQVFLPLIQQVLEVNQTQESFDAPSESDEYHRLQWTQTGRRHYPQYYQRLKQSAGCATFAGWLTPYPQGYAAEWWDSWRFWESLAAGCVTFHVDFDKYGVQLPVMPENWKHYIGIDLDNIQDTINRIADQPEILAKISAEGRQWAIDNYGPTPTALRFLETIYLKPQPLFEQLRSYNLIAFPDWLQSEERLYEELSQLIQTLAAHPNQQQILLLLDTQDISDDDINLLFNGIMMQLLLEEELEFSDEGAIVLTGQLNRMQYSLLQRHLYGRVPLVREKEELVHSTGANILPVVRLEDLNVG
ncbi:MAG: hypothetical protein ACFBSC_03555 [Microcoleaceae cyanobacterium]